jgi:GNAT superfamily N-acetyltransferase
MVDEKQIQVTDQPAEADWQWLESTIDQYNILLTGYYDYRQLSIFLRDTEGAIIAGLNAFTWGGTLRILFLWVHEKYQKQGYGTRLLAAAEQEALARGCKQSVVDTHSFQAPEFYPKQGYTTCGVIDDYPIGYQQFIFQKRLI